MQDEPEVDNSKIFVFGRSLGGAVAIQLVSSASLSPPPAGLILENTFTCTQDVALHMMPFLSIYLGWNRIISNVIIRDKWNSINAIKDIKCPILFISSLRDTVGTRTLVCLRVAHRLCHLIFIVS